MHRCKLGWFLIASVTLLGLALPCRAAPDADGLVGSRELAERLKLAAREHPKVVHVEALAKSAGGREAWHVELGTGTSAERASRPAMLVVAGLAAEDFAGTAAALAWIEELAADSALAAPGGLLSGATIHVFPRLDPDAAEAWLARPRGATTLSGGPVDDDHDGLVDEDGPEDLDGDGLITWMRVEDPEGLFIPDPKEPRLLLEADRVKGEVGSFRYLPEGVDDDHDESWNEDGPGGTRLSRNFPFGFEWFEPASGVHPVSEPLTRALADFVVEHPAIALALVYGDSDNLLGEAKGGKGEGKDGAGAGAASAGARSGGRGGGRARGGDRDGPAKPPSALAADDVPYFAQVGKLYRESLGLDKPLATTSKPGALADWLYYHRGVMALSARPFSPALQLARAEAAKGKADKEAKAGKAEEPAGKAEEPAAGAEEPAADGDRHSRGGRGKKGDEDERGKEEREFLKWLDEHAPERFIAWKSFAHPDFPHQNVEIGGFAPLALELPPPAELAETCRVQSSFLTLLAGKLPRIALRRATVHSLGKSVFELTLEVENTGYLPTVLAHGVVTRVIAPTRVTLDLPDRAFLAGARRTLLEPLPGGGGMQQARYVIHAPDKSRIEVEVVSALGGVVTTVVDLKETRP